MHMFSIQDLNCVEFETVRISKSPTTVIKVNDEYKQKKKRSCISKNWVYSWQWSFAKISQLFCHSENSVKITDIPMND